MLMLVMVLVLRCCRHGGRLVGSACGGVGSRGEGKW